MAQALDLAQAAQLKAQQAEQQLALAYQHQRQLNDLKDQFIVHVSHELRTPLTEVSDYLELLNDYHGDLDAATPHCLTKIFLCPLQASLFLQCCSGLSFWAAASLISSKAGEAYGIG